MRNPLIETARSLVRTAANLQPFRRVIEALSKEREHAVTLRIEKKLRDMGFGTLKFGPFAGFVYPPLDHRGYTSLPMKMVGTFEHELFDVTSRICATKYEHILNIGAADGYYTAGFARAISGAHVIAWEMLPFMRGILKSVVHANGVSDRVEIRDLCTPEELRSLHLKGRSLVFSDCEGAEVDLLTHANLAGLERVDILVECHDHFAPRATQILRERFESTHDIEEISTQMRSLDDLPEGLLAKLGERPDDVMRVIEEPRMHRMTWLYMTQRP